MSNVYTLGNEKNLIVYSSGNYIFLRSFAMENVGRPVTLSKDFSSSLCDIIYNDSIFYSYINTEGDILIKNITEPSHVFKLSANEFPAVFSPFLTILGENLLLTYIIKNPLDDTYSLKCIFPLVTNSISSISLQATFKNMPKYNIFFYFNSLIVNLSDGDKHLSYLLKSDGSFKEINLFDICFSDSETSMNIDIDKLKYSLEEKNRIIESIKTQYSELMITASKYRDEAIKWRNKFLN